MRLTQLLFCLPLAFVFAGCASAQAVGSQKGILAEWMTGSFSSAAQAESTEGYFDIRLETVRIWEGRDDGVWLYVQQGVADRFEEPYRQRIYHVGQDGERFSSAVYSLPGDPLELAGAWAEPERFDAMAPSDLSERTGCTVFLERQGNRFVGSTVEDRCTSQLRGASYATSEVEVSAEGLTSWDRGYDAAGEQVWGAEDGPYVFLRVEPSP